MISIYNKDTQDQIVAIEFAFDCVEIEPRFITFYGTDGGALLIRSKAPRGYLVEAKPDQPIEV